MNINTKYNLGQKVWNLSNDKIRTLTITGIEIKKRKIGSKVKTEMWYIISRKGYYSYIKQSDIFTSKHVLVKSLLKK